MSESINRTDSDLMEQKIDALLSSLNPETATTSNNEVTVSGDCGQPNCTLCRPFYTIAKRMKCELCQNASSNHDHKHSNTTNEEVRQTFDFNYLEIERIVENLIRILKSSITIFKSGIENKIENAKNNVIQRVESVKAQLDIWCFKLINELEKNKNELNQLTEKIQIDKYESKLTQLKYDIQFSRNLTKERYNDNKLDGQRLENLIEGLRVLDLQLTFEPNEDIVSTKLIGKINTDFKKLSSRAKQSCVFDIIDLQLTPLDLTVLPNNRILIADINQMAIYDEKFKLIVNRDKLNEDGIAITSVSTNFKDKIYAADNGNNQIKIIDFDLNIIGHVGSFGRNCVQFNDPRGLYFYENHLYVCDYGNKRVQKFGENLEYIGLMGLPYNPLEIVLANDLACVRANCRSIFFYKLSPFSFYCRYDGHNGTLCHIRPNICEFYPNTNRIYCYDQFGTQNEEIDLNDFEKHSFQFDVFDRLLFFDKMFILTSNKTNQLIIF